MVDMYKLARELESQFTKNGVKDTDYTITVAGQNLLIDPENDSFWVSLGNNHNDSYVIRIKVGDTRSNVRVITTRVNSLVAVKDCASRAGNIFRCIKSLASILNGDRVSEEYTLEVYQNDLSIHDLKKIAGILESELEGLSIKVDKDPHNLGVELKNGSKSIHLHFDEDERDEVEPSIREWYKLSIKEPKNTKESVANKASEELKKLIQIPEVKVLFDGKRFKVLLFGRSEKLVVDTKNQEDGHYIAHYYEGIDGPALSSSCVPKKGEKLLDSLSKKETDKYTGEEIRPSIIQEEDGSLRVVVFNPYNHARVILMEREDPLPEAIAGIGWFSRDIESIFE